MSSYTQVFGLCCPLPARSLVRVCLWQLWAGQHSWGTCCEYGMVRAAFLDMDMCFSTWAASSSGSTLFSRHKCLKGQQVPWGWDGLTAGVRGAVGSKGSQVLHLYLVLLLLGIHPRAITGGKATDAQFRSVLHELDMEEGCSCNAWYRGAQSHEGKEMTMCRSTFSQK